MPGLWSAPRPSGIPALQESWGLELVPAAENDDGPCTAPSSMITRNPIRAQACSSPSRDFALSHLATNAPHFPHRLPGSSRKSNRPFGALQV